MGIKSFLKPTKGKIAVLIFLYVLTYLLCYLGACSGYLTLGYQPFSLIDMFYTFLILPLYLFSHFGVSLTQPFVSLVLVVYFYILACIYVTAYNWLDGTLRRKYPQINARWQQREKK